MEARTKAPEPRRRGDHTQDLPCCGRACMRYHRFQEGVSELWISSQTVTPNSYRLMKSPSTKSCMRSVCEKQIVRRTNRLVRVRKLMCLLSIFWVCAFPTVCCLASTCRS